MKARGAVFVTGASSGIGAATVARLIGRGFRVFGGYRKDADAESLSAAGVAPVRIDVTDAVSVAAARDAVASQLGEASLVGLVNNAGVPGAGPVELTPVEEFARVMDVNVLGVIRVTQVFLPLLRAARGRIVMMSSISGRFAMPFLGPYVASKFALEALSDSLRRELLPEGIDVIVIEPGPIVTPIWDRVGELDLELFRGTVYEDRVDRVRSMALESGQRGLPAEVVARAVERALTSSRPRTRVLVAAAPGRLKVRLIRWLPDRLVDRLIVRRRG